MHGTTQHSSVSRGKTLGLKRTQVVSVLDVGSTKVCCLIARLKPQTGEQLRHRTHSVEVLGFGFTRSRGVKSGVVVDLDEAEKAIRIAVDQAERMAQMTISSLVVNVSCGRLKSESFTATVPLAEAAVSQVDIQRVLAAGAAHTVSEGRMVIHSLPVGYSLDGQRGMQDPEGMLGENLGVDMHIVSADDSPLRNLEFAINRCHLEVDTIVAAPYASGLSTLVDDEVELGVACIDMGGGTTTLSVFHGGQFVYSGAIPIGGQHVTLDIARGLSTGLADAERLKARHGSALPSSSDDKEILTIPAVGEDERDYPNTAPRSSLTRIIRPRIEETLEMTRDMLVKSGFADQVGKRVVLTGGASQLTGITEAARRILGRNVRLGRPLGISGLPDAAKGPGYAVAAGLTIYPQVAGIEQFHARANSWLPMESTGYLARVGRWLKESF
ncbi:cell division protein FtsA [Faunimonas pinastri]|uniref:Cell division protein FtsA n=1 Tax=Faunimonas pinastri TaxID=1855383 RepID=A0A1H9FQI3_9HYPH|nr:cell division protein FtsA [Faunimonas pinastri]SEQ40201.1 cell division protein FtsA [Faunimonas pinastri]